MRKFTHKLKAINPFTRKKRLVKSNHLNNQTSYKIDELNRYTKKIFSEI